MSAGRFCSRACYERKPAEATTDVEEVEADDIEPDEADQDAEAYEDEPIDEPEPVRSKHYNPAHRRLNEAKEREPPAFAGSWWTRGQSREEFSASADKLRGSKGASKLKTPVNFVE